MYTVSNLVKATKLHRNTIRSVLLKEGIIMQPFENNTRKSVVTKEQADHIFEVLFFERKIDFIEFESSMNFLN